MLLKILQIGHPVLRQPAEPLSETDIKSKSTQRLIALMHQAMSDIPATGLAAPQVGESIQLVMLELPRGRVETEFTAQERGEKELDPIPFQVLINPEITVEDATPRTFFEGCLSVEGFRCLVPRAIAVRIRALDEHAQPVEKVARGWYARALQHEVDHLSGILCTDLMEPLAFTTLHNHEHYWRRQSSEEVLQAVAGHQDSQSKE